MTRWVDAHSVTCAICGGLADERETIGWSEFDLDDLELDTSTTMLETAQALLEEVGSGEAHDSCFQYAERNGVPVALEELSNQITHVQSHD
ncbi:hypothetical protein [Halorarius halobius]|jgi:hypothetical protein|uniref:hypothetical protein n=1 Tax=Halorarius halobius TaxID=2962671 RepID=UPI0020CBB7E5|nr:hypothetical protein [Halorarius halobius]